jgi:hypothetical protein
LASRAASALWRTVLVICSTLEAVCCGLPAASSVRWLRSLPPLAICELAAEMACAGVCTSPTTPAILNGGVFQLTGRLCRPRQRNP